jgi:(1->4)-alpha-D-glucan 1-alpha-D-glucosylmutase
VYIPIATYRLQFHGEFPLKEARRILPYLQKLGVSTLYASPIFGSRTGSMHNYDVVDPLHIDKEIGTLEDFRQLTRELHDHQMGWLQDIVPNHMAYDRDNIWLMDVLEKGPNSSYKNFFDINWDRHADWKGKIMVPFLGAPLDELLSKSEIKLNLTADGLKVTYYENAYPLNAKAYDQILGEFEFWQQLDKQPYWIQVKEQLIHHYQQNEQFRKRLDQKLEEISSNNQKMKALLDEQYYTLEYWKLSEQKINYRRFFTINDLICLSMESREVFDYYHQFIKQLIDEGLIQGLRVDHVDGLFDPKTYMDWLRELSGEQTYLLVEKILDWDEKLPEDWAGQGATGYEFLATVNKALTDPRGEAEFSNFYEEFTGDQHVYEDIIFSKKYFILTQKMGGELDNLLQLAKDYELLPNPEDKEWKQALAVFLSGFPVYRVYPKELPPAQEELQFVQEAAETARIQYSELDEKIRHWLSLFEKPTGEEERGKDIHRLFFVQRSQQFTGPLAAKGVEDTTFYTFNRLISHNEVGDTPAIFGITVQAFHEKMKDRLEEMPHAINATATHDTKRGEDARMRINVLSEIPEEWTQKVSRWSQMNEGFKKQIGERISPDANEEYFLYQVLLGVLPFSQKIDAELLERIRNYLIKAMREAKVNTDWSAPNEEYEQQVCAFAEKILQSGEFVQELGTFAEKTTHFGVLNSLAQTLIKLTAPGVPDIYQGCELWDLSLVDPDNRRPVDYALRERMLDEIEKAHVDSAFLFKLLNENGSGMVKLYLIHKVLEQRNDNSQVFSLGDYLPLEVSEEYDEQLIAFARRMGKQWFITLAPRNGSKLVEGLNWPIGDQVWKQAIVKLPEQAPERWTNVLNGQGLSGNGELKLAEVFTDFPVALLKSQL